MDTNKIVLYYSQSDMRTITYIKDLFGIAANPMQNGFKYQGYRLKPLCYRISYWKWFIEKFYKRIVGSECRCLSIGERAILTKTVLAQMGVYWAHLFHLPSSILNGINHPMANFIWAGANNRKKLHLIKLSNITLPKNIGGWGILDLHHFGEALLIK